jgi:undecaprenyl-diphosphatase
MSFFEAILLGIVQGLTEFFPVSSSAHLKLAKHFLSVSDELYFDLLCHFGTLIALIFYLRRDILNILCSPKKILLYSLALFPLIPAYFFLKPLRDLASHPSYLGYALLFTSLLLFLASQKKVEVPKEKKWSGVLFIGVMQTMALIPGISRSGSTISAARFLGWDWREAAKFSFLLAVPTILGGEILETWKNPPTQHLPLSCYLAGFLASLSLGLFSVRFVFSIYEKGKVRPFAWYCLGVGIFAWMAFNG